MKIAARRRLAVGVLATTSALLAGGLIAPSSTAAPNGVTITPNAVVNTTSQRLVFKTTDADLTFDGTATFTRVGTSASFAVTVTRGTVTAPPDREGEAVVNFSDLGSGVGADGPGDAGTYSVSITGGSGAGGAGGGTDTCVSCFTILSPGAVSVSSVAPTSLRPGRQGNVSVIGNNFERGTRIEVLTAEGTVDSQIVPNNPPRADNSNTGEIQNEGITTRTELKRRFTVGANATPGARDVRVTNLDGSSDICTGCFFVAGADLTSISTTGDFNDPDQGLTTITFNGGNVTNGTPKLNFVANPQPATGSAGGASRGQLQLVGQNVRDYTGTSITADFDLRNAAPGSNAYQPVVESSDGVLNACVDACRFTVIQRDSRMPALTSLDSSAEAGIQSNLRQGESATFVADGANFSKGATLLFDPAAGLTITGITYDALLPDQFTVTIAAAPDAPVGNKNVRARLTDNKTSEVCSGCLTVTPSGATASPTATASPSASPSASPTASPDLGQNGRYDALTTPLRVLDTRSNRGSARTGEIVLDLSQQVTDPNATAAVLNVTVTNPTARGFLVAYPKGNPRPGTSNVNFDANQTQANEVVVALPADRRVSLFVDSARAHVITDLVGSFTTTVSNDTGRLTTNAPARVFDSRDTTSPTRRDEVVVDLSSRIPAGSTDVILNVTVTRTSGRGFVTVYPTGTARPGTSNVNFERGQTQANEVITRVGTGSDAGKVSFFVDSASAALIVDLVGAVTPGNAAGTQVFTPLQQPTRALNTRDNRGARRSGEVVVSMPATVPPNATGVVLNVTATNGTRPGFVTVYPTGSTRPETSNVNFRAESAATATRPASAGTQANEVITALGSNRQVTLFVGGAGTPAAHLIVDVVGYLTTTGAAPSASPSPTCSPSLLVTCPTPSASPSATPTGTPTTGPSPSPTATASAAA